MIHAPGSSFCFGQSYRLRAIFRITPLGAADRSRKSVWRPCRRSPPRSSRLIRSTCAEDDEVGKRQAASAPGRLAMAAKVRKGNDSARRNIAGAVWSCQAPFRAPLHADAGSANSRKWVGGKYIRHPIVRAGVSKRPRGRGRSRRTAGRASMHSRWRPRMSNHTPPGRHRQTLAMTKDYPSPASAGARPRCVAPAGATEAVRSPPLGRP